MKHIRLLLALLLLATAGLAAPRAHAQFSPILCNPTMACTQLGPVFSNTGTTYYGMAGLLNFELNQIYQSLGPNSGLAKNGTITSADIINLFSGSPSSSLCLGSQGGLVACSGGSGGNPGGSSGQVQYNNGGSFGGFTMGGDCTLNATTGVITCTKTSGTNFGFWATTTDTTSGTGTVVCLTVSCVMTTPNLGTPSALNLANATNLATTALTGALQAAQEPAHTGDATNTAGSLAMTVKGLNGTLLSGLGTGILKITTSTGVPSDAAAADVYGLWSGSCSASTFLRGDGSCQTPAGSGNVSNSGTPSAGQFAQWVSATVIQGVATTGTGSVVLATAPTLTLGNATGLPIATGVSGLASGLATFLGTPSSANLAATITDETGTGALVFGTAPTITLPNATGLPLTSGVTGLLPFANMNLTSTNILSLWTGSCSSSTYMRGDGACAAPAGSGTVNSGTSGNFGYYSSTGTAISGITPVVAQGALNGVTPNVQSGTSYGFTTADRNLPFPGTIFTAGSAITATIQNDSTVAWVAGDELAPQQGGTGTVNLTAGSGVILCSTWSYELTGSACSGSGGLNVYPTYNIYEGQVWRHTTVANTWQLTYQTPYGTQQQFNLGIGQVAMPTGSIAAQSGSTPTCSAVTVASYYAKATSKAVLTPAVDSTTVAGYVPASPGAGNLDVTWYFSNSTQPGQLNIKLCNRSASAITAGALTMNYTILP